MIDDKEINIGDKVINKNTEIRMNLPMFLSIIGLIFALGYYFNNQIDKKNEDIINKIEKLETKITIVDGNVRDVEKELSKTTGTVGRIENTVQLIIEKEFEKK